MLFSLKEPFRKSRSSLIPPQLCDERIACSLSRARTATSVSFSTFVCDQVRRSFLSVRVMPMMLRACVFAALLWIATAASIPTVYDVLQLVYQVCSTDELERHQNLLCVSSLMGKEVEPCMEKCVSEKNGTLADFCEHATQVPEWAAKHPMPPAHITRILGLTALGRMACVLGEVQRPLPMWQAAFAKCFPDFQSRDSLRKDITKNRSDNTLGED